MSDIVNFLEDRLADDLEAADRLDASWWVEEEWPGTGEAVRRFADADRVRRDVEAKLKFIREYAPPDPHFPGDCPDCDMIYLFATAYADHPDYRQEWRP